MKFASILKLTAAAFVSGALLVPGIGPATAAATYPPHVSILYASPVLTNGHAAVAVSGDHLTSGMSVKASRGTRSITAAVSVHKDGTVGTADVNVTPLLSTIAGRYTVTFALRGASVTGNTTTTQTYTVGKAISIKSFKITGTPTGVRVSGKAAKNTPVKITIKFGSKTYTKTVKAGGAGSFAYSLKKKTPGTYKATAQVAPNKKYFSDVVTATYTR